MQYHEFIGQVQHRARLGSTGEAVRATHATLEVLGQRLFGGQANKLASQLPSEVGHYLTEGQVSETFGVEEFFVRVSERENVDLPDAVHHARAVVSVVQEAVTPGEIDKVRAQLPDEYDPLFESGSEGEM
jgi:uncharacterized protein (DUF2267 family)